VKSEVAVQVHRPAGLPRRGDGQAGALGAVRVVAEGRDYVESVHPSAQENEDQNVTGGTAHRLKRELGRSSGLTG
jgi:hypothetical protein